MKQHQVSMGKGRGIFLATNAFVGAAIHLVDTDGDGVPDSQDNCINEANAPQRDTVNDSFGNRCDPDFNNDNIVNATDLAFFKTKFFSTDPDADLNGDSIVNGGISQSSNSFS